MSSGALAGEQHRLVGKVVTGDRSGGCVGGASRGITAESPGRRQGNCSPRMDHKFTHGGFAELAGARHIMKFFCKQVEQSRPATVDAITHRFSVHRSHTFKVSMFELDAGSGRVRNKTDLDLGCELFARVRLPLGTDFPAHDESLCWFPNSHVTDRDFGAVCTFCVPASTDKRFDDGFLYGGRANAMGLRPPPVDSTGEDAEGPFRARLNHDALSYRRDFDGGNQGALLVFALGISTSLLNASNAASQNWSRYRRSSPKPRGSM